jgi:hypothetical protein
LITVDTNVVTDVMGAGTNSIVVTDVKIDV